ncbi:reverse transcriptase domain-containing protein [Streptosporangium sp. NPDC049046]|uniref:reverse transcriptase domain-containing protein n=1 Tax=Streptosporangium sp. NPDC049046 TaxID=3155031 RepID=UPI003417E4D2
MVFEPANEISTGTSAPPASHIELPNPLSARTSASTLFRSVTSPSNLRRLYHDYVEDKGARGRDGIHPKSLATDLNEVTKLISRKMRAGSYRFTGYREVLELKGAGKAPRVLSIPTARDRIALRALADCLTRLFPQTRGVIPHQRVSEVATVVAAGTYDSYVKLDVVNFYPSIMHSQIEQELRTKIRKKEILGAVLGAVRTPTVPIGQRNRTPNKRGVPQGLAISNILAELVMGKIDAAASALDDCVYFRYVDDILILCNGASVNRVRDSIASQCKESGLRVHLATAGEAKSSSGSISNGFSYLGYTFSSKNVSVRKKSISNIEGSIARIFTRYKHDRNLQQLQDRINIIVTGCIYEGISYGWLNYFRQMNDIALLKHLDVTIEIMKRRHNVPTTFRNKCFVRAYWAIRYPFGKDQNYVPNFDLVNMARMRRVLETHLGEEEVAKMLDSDVPTTFKRIMRRVIIDLEKDIGHIS